MTSELVIRKTTLARKTRTGKFTVDCELRKTEKGFEFSASGYIMEGRHESYGQCLEEACEMCPNDAVVKEVVEVWRRYHLNGVRAGCEHQRKLGWTNDNMSQPCPTCGYKYGTAWLFEQIPQDVLDRIMSWPENM